MGLGEGEEEDERGDAGERAPLTLCILLILDSSVEPAEPARSSCISWLLSRAAVHTEDGPDSRLFFLLFPPFKFLFFYSPHHRSDRNTRCA